MLSISSRCCSRFASSGSHMKTRRSRRRERRVVAVDRDHVVVVRHAPERTSRRLADRRTVGSPSCQNTGASRRSVVNHSWGTPWTNRSLSQRLMSASDAAAGEAYRQRRERVRSTPPGSRLAASRPWTASPASRPSELGVERVDRGSVCHELIDVRRCVLHHGLAAPRQPRGLPRLAAARLLRFERRHGIVRGVEELVHAGKLLVDLQQRGLCTRDVASRGCIDCRLEVVAPERAEARHLLTESEHRLGGGLEPGLAGLGNGRRRVCARHRARRLDAGSGERHHADAHARQAATDSTWRATRGGPDGRHQANSGMTCLPSSSIDCITLSCGMLYGFTRQSSRSQPAAS